MTRRRLSREAFELCPVWAWDAERVEHVPVRHRDADDPELFIAADFTTGDGERFSGYVVGEGAYAVGLFIRGEEFVLNGRLPTLARATEIRVLAALGRPEGILLPLRYTLRVPFGEEGSKTGLFTLDE